MQVTEQQHETHILSKSEMWDVADTVQQETAPILYINICKWINEANKGVSYTEGIKQDQHWDLQHADLNSDADSHFQAEKQTHETRLIHYLSHTGRICIAAIMKYSISGEKTLKKSLNTDVAWLKNKSSVLCSIIYTVHSVCCVIWTHLQ